MEVPCLVWMVLSLLASFLGSFSLDRWHDTPNAVRGALLLTALAGCGVALAWWLWRWVLAQRHLGDYSRLVQRRYRILGDRLLGIVELSSDQASERGHSEELYRAAVSQVERDARQIAFADAVSIKGLRRLSLLNAFLLVVACILWALFPGAFNNAWQRWIQPQSDIQRYTLVRVTLDQDNYLMIRGEPFTIQAGVEYDSLWKPRKVSASVDTGYQIEGEVVDGRITLEIPGQFKKSSLTLVVGDNTTEASIEPVLRPTLTHLGAHIRMPAYLGLPNEHNDLQSGQLDLLEGAGVMLTGLSAEHFLRSSSNGASLSPALAIERVLPIRLVEQSGCHGVPSSGRTTGFTQARPWTLAIRQQADQTPGIQFPQLFRKWPSGNRALEIQTRCR